MLRSRRKQAEKINQRDAEDTERILVEAMEDVALRVQTKAYFLHASAPPREVSTLVTKFPEIKGLDINPVIAYEEGGGCLAVDARIIFK